MKELVDVLMAVYKPNIKMLKEQIDSILNQTHKNIKLYISDDFSQDEEVTKTLKEYEEKNSNIQVFLQNQNLGVNKNFEFLLNKSNADYIMFSDQDDIWYKDKIEKSLRAIKENKVSLVYCNRRQIDENGNVLKQDYFKYKNVPLVNGKSKIAISRCIGIGCSQIITKEVRDKMIPFKENVIAHDWLAGIIANELDGISYISEPCFDYRLHTNNVFGGRNLNQNISRWKSQNGKGLSSFIKYRKESVIDKAYLGGAKTALAYSENSENIGFINDLIKYYEQIEKTRFINFHFIKYFKFLGGKNIGKKYVREIIIFHFPILGYIVFNLK
jgi:rhamnosyltransferase